MSYDHQCEQYATRCSRDKLHYKPPQNWKDMMAFVIFFCLRKIYAVEFFYIVDVRSSIALYILSQAKPKKQQQNVERNNPKWSISNANLSEFKLNILHSRAMTFIRFTLVFCKYWHYWFEKETLSVKSLIWALSIQISS